MPPVGVIRLSNDQRQELYKSVGYDSNEMNKAAPKGYVKAKIHIHLGQGSITLLSEKKNTPLVQLALNNIISDVELQEESFKCLVTMADLNLIDLGNPRNQFPKVISRTKSKKATSALASIYIEKNPPSASANKCDYYFAVTFDRIDIVLNVELIQAISM